MTSPDATSRATDRRTVLARVGAVAAALAVPATGAVADGSVDTEESNGRRTVEDRNGRPLDVETARENGRRTVKDRDARPLDVETTERNGRKTVKARNTADPDLDLDGRKTVKAQDGHPF